MKPEYHLYKKTYTVFPVDDHEIIAELEEDKTVYAQDIIWIPLIILIVVLLM